MLMFFLTEVLDFDSIRGQSSEQRRDVVLRDDSRENMQLYII